MDVGIWLRVSTEEQAQGDSPKNHAARARMYAELKRWNVAEIYDLSGVSGKSVIEHPEAKRMMNDVQSGRIKALIFSKLARLARNVRELLEFSDFFQKYNADLVSLEESIDTSSPAGRLLFTVIGALAQWEREEISARVAASVPIRAKLGNPLGGSGPFGYHWVDKKFIVNPDEAPIVKEIFSLYVEVKRLLITARLLNERGYRSRKGARFGKTAVKRILTDPVYKGIKRANYSRSKGNGKSWMLKPPSEWVYHDVEPLVDEEVWTEANNIIEINAKPFPRTPPPIGKYLFSNTLVCGKCNAKMYVAKYGTMTVPRYVCRTCRVKINEDVLMAHFKDSLKRIVVTPEQLKDQQQDGGQIIQDKQAQMNILKNNLGGIKLKLDKIIGLFSEGFMDKNLLAENVIELKKRKDEAENEIARLNGEIDYIKTSQIGREYVLSQAASLHDMWDIIDSEGKNNITKKLVNKVILNNGELTFVFVYLPDIMEFPSSLILMCKPDQTLRDSWPPRA